MANLRVGGWTVVMAAVALAAGGAVYVYRDKLLSFGIASLASDDQVRIRVVIPPGTAAREIATILEDAGVIGDATLFYRWVRYVAKKETAMKGGEYELSPSMSPEQILTVLEEGKSREIRVTIREGLRKEEVAEVLADAGLSTKDALLAAMNDPATAHLFGVPTSGADGQDSVPGGIEGYLFPDTYRFYAVATPAQILHRMRRRLDEVIDAKMTARMTELGWDLHKTLTLAAIIEKETGARAERPIISGVFHNRLKKRMKLQTDPTVVYGILDHDGDIKRSDLLREHAYNTYVIPGLPPGPIAQPGVQAIKAALWPAATNALFFVARGDTGEHEFCETLECHNTAVQTWQVEYWAKKRGG